MLRILCSVLGMAVLVGRAEPPFASTNTAPTAASPKFEVGVQLPPDEQETAYRKLLALDDQVAEEIDVLIREADAKGVQTDEAPLQVKVDELFQKTEKAYLAFLTKYPEHAKARVAFGSFLNDAGRELEAREQWERAAKLDPRNPAVFNNLAGVYGHRGPVTNAFVLYEKAIELAPREATYYRNFATMVFLFRRDVMAHYAITNEQLVFDKALTLYRKAAELAPTDFHVAADLAQTFYGIKPSRHEEALQAWRKALPLAGDDLEREGVRVHLARVLVQAGRLTEARTELDRITNAHYAEIKGRIQRTLEGKEGKNEAPASVEKESKNP